MRNRVRWEAIDALTEKGKAQGLSKQALLDLGMEFHEAFDAATDDFWRIHNEGKEWMFESAMRTMCKPVLELFLLRLDLQK